MQVGVRKIFRICLAYDKVTMGRLLLEIFIIFWHDILFCDSGVVDSIVKQYIYTYIYNSIVIYILISDI